MSDPIYLASAIALSVTVIFALTNHIQHIAVGHMDVRNGTIVLVATATVILWLLAPFYLDWASLLTAPAGWFALAGLIVPSLSMTLQTLSVRTIGPGLTSGLASTSPVFATIIAVTVLGEIVTSRLMAGTAIVMVGIALIALRSRISGPDWPVWAVAIPLGAALARGISHNIIKHGLNGLPSPMTAALIGSTTSLIILLIVHRASGRTMPRPNAGFAWFALAGIFNGLGLIGLNFALAIGSVVVVSPLVATTPAITLILGWLVFRRETLSWQSIAAIAVIFSGCLMIITR